MWGLVIQYLDFVSSSIKKGDWIIKSRVIMWNMSFIFIFCFFFWYFQGFATTARITSGVAPALYASSADKNWESNQDVIDAGCKASDADDIATQLIHGPIGSQFKVIFGGGRKNFVPTDFTDEDGKPGVRTDGKNLIKEWEESKNGNAVYISTNTELGELNTTNIDYLLGIFESDRLRYNLDVVEEKLTEEPKLVRLCHYSLEMLQKKEHSNGFVLLLESKWSEIVMQYFLIMTLLFLQIH